MDRDVAAAIEPVEAGPVLVRVWVVPRAKRSELAGMHAGALRVRVAAAPERGRANQAVADLLADIVGGRVELHDGATSRRKRFAVHGLTAQIVARRLAAALSDAVS